MRPSARIAAITCWAFTMAMLWPLAARAAEAQPPPPAGLPTTTPAPPPAVPPPPPSDAESGAPAGGEPEVDQARQHFETGKNAYNAGDYAGAIREFKAAGALRPSPVLSYNIGLANEKLGKRAVAIKYYQRYLQRDPNASNRAEVEARIAHLEQGMGSAPPTTTPAPPSQMPPPDPNAMQGGAYAAPPPALPPPRHHNYWWIWLVVGGGIVLTATIVAVALTARDAGPAYYYDRAPPSRTPAMGAPLFRF